MGALLHEFVKRIPAWVWVIAALPVFGWIYTRLFLDRDQNDGKIPIAVQDPVDAAASGKWTMLYEESDTLFRTLP